MRGIGLIALLVLAPAAEASAQATVFIVRHAERADAASGAAMMNNDPELSPEGRQRSERLASILKDADITAIYATEFKRTQQTAAPLAGQLKIKVTTVGSKDIATLLKFLESASGNALVVGHSNTIPDILAGLGIKTRIAIQENQYDNLFVATTGAAPRLVRLHFQ